MGSRAAQAWDVEVRGEQDLSLGRYAMSMPALCSSFSM